MQIKIGVLKNSLHELFSEVKSSKLLMAWLILGPVIAFLVQGVSGFASSIVNLIVVTLYALLIRGMTVKQSKPVLKKEKIELWASLGLIGVFLLVQLFYFDVLKTEPFYSWVNGFHRETYIRVFGLDWVPEWAKMDLYLAATSTLKNLLPTAAVFIALGYKPDEMRLKTSHKKLSIILVAITTALGVATGYFFRRPFIEVLGLSFIGVLINALPEELLFRGLLLPRLENQLKNPMNALVVSAILFNALHLPINIYNGMSVLDAFLRIFALSYPSGLIWGYLYMRTRSIVPGVLWHAANMNLGFILFSL